MVSALALALVVALAGLAAVAQPPKVPGRILPGNVAIAPANPLQHQKGSTGKCSIPLINVSAGARQPMGWSMPVIRPRETGRMPIVQPPAPPCASGPPK
jgi:hypothetical protein